MADTIATVRRRRGTVRGRLTRIERDISSLEEKETLTPSERRKIMRLNDQVKEHDQEFEKRHMEVLDFIEEEDQVALNSEEKVFDEHVNRVADIIERLEKLEDLVTTEPVTHHASGSGDVRPGVRSVTEAEHLSRRLDQVHDSLTKVKRVKDDRSLDACSLEGHEERIKSIDADLQIIKRDMLLLGDYKSLAEKATALEEASFEIRVAIKRRLKNLNAESSRSKDTELSEVKLPKVSVPTFDGKVLNWKNFWEQFDVTIHSKTALSDTAKLMYLQDALKDGPARFVIQGLTRTSESYEEAIKCLKERYDRPRLVEEEHIRSIVDAVPVKSGSEKELRRLYDAATQHYRALKAAKTDSFDTVLTVILQQKLDEKTRLKWAEFSSEHESVPPCTELLKFLDLQARQLESVAQVGHKHASGSDRKIPSVKPSYAISTDDACLACKKRGHQIHTCSVFKGRTWADRFSVVKDLGLCMNCLRAGHIAEKCRAPSMCRKCTRHHHTLLHRDADNSTQRKPDNAEAKEEAHVAALSVTEQVLLMTCKVKVTAPNGSSTIARALIDPGSSTSFVHERITQLLRLPRTKKNVLVEGVGGTSTPTRGSVWFQVSGVEDGAEKIGVEAYVLKKVTRDLPLHPIPIALKWDHLSNLELADPEFRTPARIDLLLGAEVFASILRDGRRTGPRGTPSAINTCLGWVLFGKINDSDVVDVANNTLEQEESKYFTGSGRSYAAVVRAGKKNDLRRPRRRNGRVAKGLLDSRHDDCRIYRREFDKIGPRNVRKENLPWRNTWETKGFRPAVCWRQIAIN